MVGRRFQMRVYYRVIMWWHVALVCCLCTIEGSGKGSPHRRSANNLHAPHGSRHVHMEKQSSRTGLRSTPLLPCFVSSFSGGINFERNLAVCRHQLQLRSRRPAATVVNLACRLDVETDHYSVLGVASDANYQTIKAAYRKLSRRHHPDVSEEDDDVDSFYRINAAYEVLSNPDLRKRYDEAKGIVSKSETFIQGLEEMASKMYGATGSVDHTCNAFCSCGELNIQTPYTSKMPPGKMARKTSGGKKKPVTREARYTSAMEDRIKTSTFEEILEMEAKARWRAESGEGPLGRCGLCGVASVPPGGTCSYCFAGEGAAGGASEQRSSVTGVYTMHKTATRLDSEGRHNLVHKHHFERPAHTKRAFGLDIPDEDTLLSHIASDTPPSAVEEEAAVVSEWRREGEEEATRRRRRRAEEEEEDERILRKKEKKEEERASAEEERARAEVEARRREERMYLCPTCGCHTTSLLRCDACGSDRKSVV